VRYAADLGVPALPHHGFLIDFKSLWHRSGVVQQLATDGLEVVLIIEHFPREGSRIPRYLPASADQGNGTSPARQPGQDGVVVTESDARPFGQRIAVGGHDLAADEPAAIGGADSGPTPYDLLLAGLGACTSITVRMYAERKGWPLRLVTVRLRHRRIHASDCTGCETQTGRLDHIERELQFDGELTAEQRARLLDIAERCPVHRTLHSEVLVSTTQAVLGGESC
jgi:putative redox protein